MDPSQREGAFRTLAEMPGHLDAALAGLSPEQAKVRGPDGMFCPVEQAWHLADLEREGFGYRIARLLSDDHPTLPDFHGGRLARDRDYRARSLAEGLAAFADARRRNLEAMEAIPEAAWLRTGTQVGVGPVTLSDLPRLMCEHDAEHRAQIAEWRRQVGRA